MEENDNAIFFHSPLQIRMQMIENKIGMLSCNFIDFVCAVILHLLVEGNEIYKFAYLHKNNLHITMFWHCIAGDALLSVGSVFFFLFFFLFA